MLHWILILPLVLFGDAPQLDKSKVDAAVAALDKAFKDGESGDRVRAIEGCAELPAPEIVARVAKGLRDKDARVARAAIDGLRFLDHPDAVKILNERARQADAKKDPLLFAGLLKAVAQHGSPTSIEALSDDPWSPQDAKVIEARILGLGRIRTKEAVEKLFDLMKVAGPQKIQPLMHHFRAALIVLTGADQGTAQDLWLRWWNDNKGKLKVSKDPAELPKPLQALWNDYWRDPKSKEAEQPKPEGDSGGKGGESKKPG